MRIHSEPDNPTLAIEELSRKGFNVYKISGTVLPPLSYARRDYYKIVLGAGEITIGYGDQTIEINGTFLLFFNPHVPYSVAQHAIEQKGYACLFTEAFIESREWSEQLRNAPYFRFDGTPGIPVNGEQEAFMTGLFQKMLSIHSNSRYAYKDDMLRRCLELIMHEAWSIQPSPPLLTPKNAAARITQLFMELLERQFPIESVDNPLRLRTAQDFAQRLAVHVNYLNRSVKEMTGKPTSVHIAERIVAEARALLQHTTWSVADIAYGLGFDYPTYFNNYFKRVTGIVPKSLRKVKV